VINNQEKLKILLQVIKQLHMSTGHFPTGLTVFERIRLQIKQLEEYEIPFPSKSVQNALNKLKYYEKLFESEPLAPCHNDLNALNIIINEDAFKFIDWSDAGMGHAFNDLGFFSLVNCLREEQDCKILDLYLERLPSEKELNLFKHLKIVNTLRIFSNNFSPFELPIKNEAERMERIAELEKILWGRDLFPIRYYLNLHIKGQLNSKELVISTCLSALRTFLELAYGHDDA
jgi:thiamine kinase-like enzyme